MLDALIAAAQNVNPLSIPIYAIALLAAGMYPIGLMLGSPCSKCCGCAKCTGDSALPDTLTVKLSGLPTTKQGPPLCTLAFSSCFGFGASGRVSAPGGDPGVDDGPISSVTLTQKGSGYAKLGRAQPTVTASAPGGSDAVLGVTLAQQQDACGVDYWEVSSVSVTNGGTGYRDGKSLTFSVANGDTVNSNASAKIETGRTSPSLTAASSGSATFNIEYSKSSPPDTWSITDINVVNGGTNSVDGEYLKFTLGDADVQISPAYAKAYNQRAEPLLPVGISTTSGINAQLSALLTKTSYGSGDAWTISTISIDSGGIGYQLFDSLFVDTNNVVAIDFFYAYVSDIDEDGAITAITIDSEGLYYADSGIVETVSLMSGGSYYGDDGIISAVSIESNGQFWRDDSSKNPYVADVTVSIVQNDPSNGSGAKIEAKVETTPGISFGQIKELVISNAGADYLAWKNQPVCTGFYNGTNVVLQRNAWIAQQDADGRCRFTHEICGNGSLSEGGPSKGVIISAEYRGADSPPVVTIPFVGAQSSDTPPIILEFVGTQNVADCGSWGELVCKDAESGATATITAGGKYDQAARNPGFVCHPCCRGTSKTPFEIEVEVDDNRVPTDGGDVSGLYVLSGYRGVFSNVVWSIETQLVSINVSVSPCNTGCAGAECVGKCIKKTLMTIYKAAEQNWMSWDGNNECASCVSAPVCSPAGKVWMRTPNQTRTGEITVDISVPT